MASILLLFSRIAAAPMAEMQTANTAMATVATNPSPIETAAKQHTMIFAAYIAVLLLAAVFTYLVWRSGNKVQDAIRQDADVRIAEANERAAEANRIAEEERLARIRIEERLAGWRLEPEAEKRLLEKLRPFAQTPFDLAVNPVELRFMQVMDGILLHAGWTWRQPPIPPGQLFIPLLGGRAAINYTSGITIEVAQERWNEFGPAATALTQGLIAEGIPVRGNVFNQGGDASAIHIVIGNRE